jgi:RimJ/RimL family protein N-acetyltransferase
MIHAEQKTAEGIAALCDAEEADIDSIIDYWQSSTEEFLVNMGVDLARLGRPAQMRARYMRALRTADPAQSSILFSIRLDGTFAGFTLLNQYDPQINYSHWHIVNPAKRGSGISTALYPHRVKMYFDTTNMDRLIHQTRPRNIGVNRMLDKFVGIAETSFVEKPDGVAAPGVFHLRYVYRRDVESLFEIAGRMTGKTLR